MGFVRRMSNFALHPTTQGKITAFLITPLLIALVFLNVAILQQQQQLASMAASPDNAVSTSNIFSEGFAPIKINILKGKVISGDVSGLTTAGDNRYFVLESVKNGEVYNIDWETDFDLGTGVKEITISGRSRYSTYIGQQIKLFNYVKSEWKQVIYTTIGPLQNFETTLSDISEYVSSEGRLKIKVYSIAGGKSYRGFFDNLKVNVKYGETIVIPTSVPVTPSATPMSTRIPTTVAPTATLTPKPIVSSKNYSPSSMKMIQGKVLSGDISSLVATENKYFIVDAVKNGNLNYTDWETYFNLGTGVKEITISGKSRYSTYIGQKLKLFNYVKNGWEQVKYSTIGPLANFTVTLSNVSEYISSTGQMIIKMDSIAGGSFRGWFDYLNVEAKY